MTDEEKLDAFGLFYDIDDSPDEAEFQPPKGYRDLNLSDTFFWATAWCKRVSPDEIKEIAVLFGRYGEPGMWYWVLKDEGIDTVEFADVNRQVEFVRNEERIRESVPGNSKRAYHKESYTIGATP